MRRSDLFLPAVIEPLFWRPRMIDNSPVLVHAPFIFWLLGVLRPQEVVNIGTKDCVGHFIFCQGMDKINVAGRCRGYVLDPSALEIPAILRDHEAQLYDDLSTLSVRGSAEEALAELTAESLDVLFVDLDAPGGIELQEDACACIKAEGVLILHGTNDLESHKDHGLTLLHWLQNQPQINFRTGRGLTIVVRSERAPALLRTLVERCRNGNIPQEIDRVFHRLGQGIENLAELRRTRLLLEARDCEADRLIAAHRNSETALQEMRSAYDQRNNRISSLQVEIFDCRQLLAEANERIGVLIAEKESLATNIQSRTAALAEADERIDEMLGQLNDLQCSAGKLKEDADKERARLESEKIQQIEIERAIRFRETEALTRELECLRDIENQNLQLGNKLRSMQAEIESVSSQLKVTRQKFDDVVAGKQVAEEYVKALLASTSWRITAPLRKVKAVLSSRNY